MDDDVMSKAVPVHEDAPPPKSMFTKNQTIVDTIKAPRLKDVTFLDFIKFKKARENYEREVSEKNKEPGVDIHLASYITCVDHNVLDLFVERQYIKKNCVEDVTDQDILQCINSRCDRRKGDFEITDVVRAIRSVHIKLGIPGAEPRIDTLLLDYKRALESAGYSTFTADCPKLAIAHIYERLKPQILK